MTVECNKCGQTWESDPAKQVTCLKCGAEPGAVCRRPSGHPVNMGTDLAGIHRQRDAHAMEVLEEYGGCSEVPDGEIEPVRDTVTTQQTRLGALTDGGKD